MTAQTIYPYSAIALYNRPTCTVGRLYLSFHLTSWLFPFSRRPQLHKCLVGSGTDRTSLLILLLLFFFFLERPLQKSLRLRRFKSDQGEIWQECSPSKYASIDGVRFLIWRHSFKTAAVTSFQAEKCCQLVSAHAASTRRVCSSVRQFQLRSIHSC